MVVVMAHRGSSGVAPENSFMSFQKAIEHSADYIELDVRKCATGELIVMHDSRIDRTTTGKGTVSRMALSEIKSYHIKGVKKGYKKDIPTLEEVINLVKGKCKLNIELKSKKNDFEIVEKLSETLKKHKFEKEVVVSSYRHAMIKKLVDINPKIETAALFIEKKSPSLILRRMYYISSYIRKTKHVKASALNLPHQFITPRLMKSAVKHGLKVNAWTVNSSKSIERMKQLGVDGIITNYPQRIKHEANL